MIERERIFYFLISLNLKFDKVCAKVLGKVLLPSISEVFSYVQGEEGHKGIMVWNLENKLPMSNSFVLTTLKIVGKG